MIAERPRGWLALDAPPGWLVVAEPRRRSARLPGVDLLLEWGPLAPLPASHKPWIDEILLGPLPAGGRYDGLGFERARTRDGWEVTLAGARLYLPGGAPQLRLGAFYVFMAHGAHALLSSGDAAAFDSHRAGLREVLLGGRPDFAACGATLAEFWDGLELSRPTEPTAP